MEALGRTNICQKIGMAISYPPLETNHFNEDGRDQFRSKITVITLIPLILVFFSVAAIFFFPMFVDMPIRTDLTTSKLSYNFHMVSNATDA